MIQVNYSQIYKKLTKGLSPKVKEIFDRRFGIKLSVKDRVQTETLDSIGKSFKITRERVRQIEEAGFSFVRKHNKEILDKIFTDFNNYFESKGGFKREEVALEDLGGKNYKPYVLFFLALGGSQFNRVCGKKDYHYFWATSNTSDKLIKDNLTSLVADTQKHGKLLTKKELFDSFAPKYNLHNEALASYMEISKRMQENKDGKIGLADWPEIKPRGVKDKAFLVFKHVQKPLHFRKITELIDELEYNQTSKKTHPQTVHNELIKDQRFVLVGRGMYALREWGYVPGTIKDVITKILTEKQAPPNQDELVKEVLSQRLVAKNTVLINLNNKKYFKRDPQGRYFLRETQLA